MLRADAVAVMVSYRRVDECQSSQGRKGTGDSYFGILNILYGAPLNTPDNVAKMFVLSKLMSRESTSVTSIPRAVRNGRI